MMLVALEINVNIDLGGEQKNRIEYSRAQNQYVLKHRRARDTLSYKLAIMGEMEEDLRSGVSRTLDLSRYERRAIPETFHGLTKPSWETVLESFEARQRLQN